ncbi:MAG: hypothetical protein FJZ98_02290 [Chloroflexi bacterium]|nr:hypothetical protein [Chloroflexota bacterium]
MNDILKRLQELGLKVDRASNLEVKRSIGNNVDSFIPGEWVESNNGRIYVVKQRVPYGSKHGNTTLKQHTSVKQTNDFWDVDGVLDLKMEDIVFLDTETSSLSIGAGALIFLFGCCYFDKEGLEVLQVFIEDPSHETLFLTYIGNTLEKFKCLATYNGKSFDIPVLRSRYILNRIPHELNGFLHIDLLHISRRIWKYDLDSKKLSDIEKNVLQFTRGEEEIPGWLVPQIYQDFVQTGNAEPLKGVFYHNEIDVVSLAGLFLKIENMLSSNQLQGNEPLSLGEIFHRARKYELANEYYKKALEYDSNDVIREKTLVNLAYSLKKQGKLKETCSIWEELAQAENLTACVELAKFHEHKEKDWVSALEWTEKAILISEKLSALRLREELAHRKSRLILKLGKKE